MSRQSSTASLSAMDTSTTWYSGTPASSHIVPPSPLAPPAPLASLGHGSGSGANVIAAAASQAIAATQQV
jgi:hypothetical protein